MIFIGDLKPYCLQLDTSRAMQYKHLLEQADRYKQMELPLEHPKESTTYMGIAIANLALAYRLSGSEQYLQDAKRFMNTVLSYEKWGNAHLVNVDLSASWILFGLSLGYDWLKPYLSEEEKQRIFCKIRHHAKVMFDYRRDTYGSGWSTNFYQNHNWINMTGLAAAGYAMQGQAEEADTYIKEAKEDFARVFDLMAEDGSNYEGVTYWRYGGMWLFVYAHLLKVQEGIDYFQSSPYLKNTFYYRLYQCNGDFTRQMNYGDCHDRYSSHPVCVYYKVAAEYRNGHAQKLGNMVVKEFLAQEAANSKVKPGILPEAIFEFLWYDPSVEEREFDDLPLARYFEDLGLLALRSSWQRDARVFSIKCGAPGGAKQWREGWKILQDEGIDLFSLSHHHPDNLSYIFASGGEYFTCEDGYNRNLMPDNHNVLLVDGRYTDAQDVNDVYMTSVEQRQKEEGKDFSPESYGGFVSCVKVEGNLAVYRGETAGVYPRHMQMQEVSRVLVTDGLGFWLFADIFNSQKSHIYSVICNTDPLPCPQEKGYRYPMETGDIRYQVFSSAPTETRQYEQQVVSVMTTQEQDKLCRTCIHTLSTDSQTPQTSQVFFECFTFAGSEAKVCCQQGMLHLEWNGNVYKLTVGEYDAGVGRSPVRLRVTRDGAETAEYSL